MCAATLPAVAANDTLNIYTYSSFASDWGPGPAIKTAFEAQCDCNVNYVALDDGVSILNRLRLEGEKSNADIILGLDDNLIVEATQTGLIAKHDVDTTALTLPGGWQDSHFVPFDYGYFAFVYNKTQLENPPTSLKDLIERDDIKILYQDPRTSTPGQGLMLWVKHVYGVNAFEAWGKIAKKTVTVTKGWSEAYSMFLDGEADMVLSYTTSPAYHLIAEEDSNYAAAHFDEGHYMQVEVAAKLKHAPNAKLADDFLQFMLSEGFQQHIATGNWMYPVIDVDLPAGFETLTVPKTPLNFSAEEVNEKRRGWIREWQTALIQ
nr:thiamine ABC transporter substrate binding subunit [Thaumasiovibrio subtropicus]